MVLLITMVQVIVAQTRKETQDQQDFSETYFQFEMFSSNSNKFRDKIVLVEELVVQLWWQELMLIKR